mmetsp:Transcript_14374/g.22442  ORF Transcript_14374/g.22442 Transcript_14374/m.22442 type:complete len:206 (+) Transcript_14374:2039-2656(+)
MKGSHVWACHGIHMDFHSTIFLMRVHQAGIGFVLGIWGSFILIIIFFLIRYIFCRCNIGGRIIVVSTRVSFMIIAVVIISAAIFFLKGLFKMRMNFRTTRLTCRHFYGINRGRWCRSSRTYSILASAVCMYSLGGWGCRIRGSRQINKINFIITRRGGMLLFFDAMFFIRVVLGGDVVLRIIIIVFVVVGGVLYIFIVFDILFQG